MYQTNGLGDAQNKGAINSTEDEHPTVVEPTEHEEDEEEEDESLHPLLHEVWGSSLRNRVFRLLNGGYPPYDTVISGLIMGLIILNVGLFIASTVPLVAERAGGALDIIELGSSIIFTAEFCLRLWACQEKLAFAIYGPLLGRLRFLISPTSIIDLASFLPYWIEFIVLWIRFHDPFRDTGVSFIAAIRIFRLFTLLKAEKYLHALGALKSVLLKNRDVLGVSLTLAVTLFLATATALYYAQLGNQSFHYVSIPDAMFPAVLLLTGQGYEHLDALTTFGIWVVTFSSVFSIAVFAVPAGMLSFGFEGVSERFNEERQLNRRKRRKKMREKIDKARAKGVFIKTPPESETDESSISSSSSSDEESTEKKQKKIVIINRNRRIIPKSIRKIARRAAEPIDLRYQLNFNQAATPDTARSRYGAHTGDTTSDVGSVYEEVETGAEGDDPEEAGEEEEGEEDSEAARDIPRARRKRSVFYRQPRQGDASEVETPPSSFKTRRGMRGAPVAPRLTARRAAAGYDCDDDEGDEDRSLFAASQDEESLAEAEEAEEADDEGEEESDHAPSHKTRRTVPPRVPRLNVNLRGNVAHNSPPQHQHGQHHVPVSEVPVEFDFQCPHCEEAICFSLSVSIGTPSTHSGVAMKGTRHKALSIGSNDVQ